MATLHEAYLRHSQHYLRVIWMADTLYKEGGSAINEALGIFDSERANIDIGQRWAADHINSDKKAAVLCNDYPNASVYFLNLRLLPSERAKWFESAMYAAQRLGDREAEGWHTGNLGRVYRDMGKARSALNCFQKVLAISREIHDRSSEARSLSNMASAYFDLGQPDVALKLLEEALPITREIKDRNEEGGVLGKLGTTHSHLGNPREAINFYSQQLIISQETRALGSEAEARVNIGIVYRTISQPSLALKWCKQAFDIYKNLGDRRHQAATLNCVGLAHLDRREFDEAVLAFDEQLVLCREMEDPRGEGKALFNKALTLNEFGDHAQALSLAEDSLTIFEQLEAPEVEIVKATISSWRQQ